MPAVSASQAPPEVLEKLRAIDARAELVHLGGTTWWLGIREVNNPAKDQLERMLKVSDTAHSALEVTDAFERAMVLERIAKEHHMRRIMAYGTDGMSGFRPVELRECTKLGDFYELVEDFRRADWTWKTFGVQRALEQLREAGRQASRWAERVRQDAGSWFHHFVRRSTSVLNPWGARKGAARDPE